MLVAKGLATSAVDACVLPPYAAHSSCDLFVQTVMQHVGAIARRSKPAVPCVVAIRGRGGKDRHINMCPHSIMIDTLYCSPAHHGNE